MALRFSPPPPDRPPQAVASAWTRRLAPDGAAGEWTRRLSPSDEEIRNLRTVVAISLCTAAVLITFDVLYWHKFLHVVIGWPF